MITQISKHNLPLGPQLYTVIRGIRGSTRAASKSGESGLWIQYRAEMKFDGFGSKKTKGVLLLAAAMLSCCQMCQNCT